MNDRCDDVIVARKYAQAFVNVHAAAVSVRLLDCFLKAESFLQRQHDILFLLSIPYLEQQQRNQMVKTLVAYFSLPVQCEQLFLLMILQHHIAQKKKVKKQDLVDVLIDSSSFRLNDHFFSSFHLSKPNVF